MGCSPEDLPEAMDDREGWQERVRNIDADGQHDDDDIDPHQVASTCQLFPQGDLFEISQIIHKSFSILLCNT